MAESLTSIVSTSIAFQKFKRIRQQNENPFSSKVFNQKIAIVPSFTLESGVTILNAPLAYKTWGELSSEKDNALVVCHAFTGSADVSDWWNPLLGGSGRAFDITKFFVICMNSLGSPYGSASPVTYKDGDPKNGTYGPEFPLTTIRDDVNFHKLLLDELGVKQIAAIIGGSMGGMLALEWAYFGKDYIRCIIPIATSSRHSAWCIAWGEAQRQSIYADPKYNDGYYSLADPPNAGLGAARMSALLTYRTRDSFEVRFSRKTPDKSIKSATSQESSSLSPEEIHLAIHNDGNLSNRYLHKAYLPPKNIDIQNKPVSRPIEFQCHNSANLISDINPEIKPNKSALTYFSAQSYLRYKGSQFVKRFDSNCYIASSRKLDTHDLSRSRTSTISEALALIEQPTLVLGIESDGLFKFSEQTELASGIPNSRLEKINSLEGHDAFLLQCEQVNAHVLSFFREVIPDKMETKKNSEDEQTELECLIEKGLRLASEEDDITAW